MVTKVDEKWDAIGDNPLVIVSKIKDLMMEAREQWVDDVNDFMEDDDVLWVLNVTTRIIAGEVPEPSKIALTLARLEAASLKFRTQYAAYMSYKKGTTEANMKKNHYKEIYTGIDRLVDALKYVAK
jgi:hypothetical protein